MLRTILGKFLLTVAVCGTLALTAHTQTKYKYTFFEATPDETYIVVTAINNNGDVVGYNNTTVNGQYVTTGFERTATGTITSVVDPNSNDSYDQANGINNKGEIVGDYLYSNGSATFFQSYTDIGGAFTTYSVDANQSTKVFGVNDDGYFVGQYYTGSVYHGFVDVAGAIIDIDVPSADYTYPESINNAGKITGLYAKDATYRGFLANEKGRVLESLNYPGAYYSIPGGINNHSVVAGYYLQSNGSTVWRGFTYEGGVYTAFNIPGAASTVPFGINDSGQIAGYVITTAGNYAGFIATPVK